MKRIIFALVLTALAFGIRANASRKNFSPDDDRLRAAAVSVVSDKPGQEGVQILKDFAAGDNTYLLNRNSRKDLRRKALKMAEELYFKDEISYRQYVMLADDLGLKAKPQFKMWNKQMRMWRSQSRK